MKAIRSRHIGLLLLLVFTSSLMADSVIAAHNLQQLSEGDPDRITSAQFCLSGYNTHQGETDASFSGSSLKIAESTGPLLLIPFPDDQTDERGTTIISNCSTSLQLLASDTEPLIDPQLSELIDMAATQFNTLLFVKSLADPPRIG